MKKTILVTGGAGFIGSHTVLELINQGYRPVVFDDLSAGHEEHLLAEDFFQGDIRKIEDLRAVFKKYTFDAVIHFAAKHSVPDSIADPEKYYETNIIGGLNLLKVMRERDVKKIVFSSSAAVYGEPQTEVISENHSKNPTNPYGHTKLVFEQFLQAYHKSYDFSSVSYRYFSAAGASKNGKLGELHNPPKHVIPIAILTALGVYKTFEIFGTDYGTKDGTCIRDFIHVQDLAEAHVLCLGKLEKSICKQFNLGSSEGYSIKEIVDTVKKISGKDFRVIESGRRQGDPSRLIADNTKVKQFLLWQPKITSIEEIVQDTYNFTVSNLNYFT